MIDFENPFVTHSLHVPPFRGHCLIVGPLTSEDFVGPGNTQKYYDVFFSYHSSSLLGLDWYMVVLRELLKHPSR